MPGLRSYAYVMNRLNLPPRSPWLRQLFHIEKDPAMRRPMLAYRVTALLLAVSSMTAVWGQVTLPTGVTVPKDHFIVYICVGNSEMEGQTTVNPGSTYRALWDSTSPRLWSWSFTDKFNPTGLDHAWVPAQGKNHAGSLWQYPDWLGPDMPFLKELEKQYPSDYYFAVLKVACQGNRLRKQYINDETGTDYLPEWTRLQACISAIGPNTVTWGGLFCIFCDMEEHDVVMGYPWADAALNGMAADAETLLTRVRDATNSDIPLLWVQPAGPLYDPTFTQVFATGYQQSMLIPTQISRAANIPVWWLPDTAQLLSTYYQVPIDGHFNDSGLVRLAEEVVSVIVANDWVPSPSPDTAAPTAPSDLAASSIGATNVSLTWSASIDDKGVDGYIVYCNGDSVTAVNSTWVTITDLASSTAYTFTVKAYDYSGKRSPFSASLPVTTVIPGVDTQPPTVPSSLHAVEVGLTSAVIAWSPSTDNVGVTGYIVYQDGVPVDTVTATQDSIDGLTQKTAYTFAVAARDSAGNISVPSDTLQVTKDEPVVFPFRVNVGGPSMGEYQADRLWIGTDYGYAGTTLVATGSGDVSGTTEDSIYCTARHGADMEYRIVVRDGRYDVTLMFADFWHLAGDRLFTPFINGVAVTAQPIDVAATVGPGAAYTMTVRTKVTGGLIDITFTHQGEFPILNGLVVDNAPAYAIVEPRDGDTTHVGDTLHIRWQANENLVTGADIFISPDDGESWLLVNTAETVTKSDPNWEDFPFVVPNQMQIVGMPLTLKVEGYGHGFPTTMAGHFFVAPGSGVGSAARAGKGQMEPRVRRVSPSALAVVGLAARDPASIAMYRPDGSVAYRRTVRGVSSVNVDLGRFGAGVYLITVSGRAMNLAEKVSVFR